MVKRVIIVENKPSAGIVTKVGAVDLSQIIFVEEWNMPADKEQAVRLTFRYGQTLIVRGTVNDFIQHRNIFKN